MLTRRTVLALVCIDSTGPSLLQGAKRATHQRMELLRLVQCMICFDKDTDLICFKLPSLFLGVPWPALGTWATAIFSNLLGRHPATLPRSDLPDPGHMFYNNLTGLIQQQQQQQQQQRFSQQQQFAPTQQQFPSLQKLDQQQFPQQQQFGPQEQFTSHQLSNQQQQFSQQLQSPQGRQQQDPTTQFKPILSFDETPEHIRNFQMNLEPKVCN